MEGLGRDFDVVAVADGVFLDMQNYQDVTFIGVLASGDTFTVQEATAVSGGTEQDLDVIDHWYAQVNGDGTDSWTLEVQSGTPPTPDAAVTEGDDVVAIHVSANSLSDGFTHLKCTATSTGVVIAILHGLAVQRDPANLPAVSA